MILKSVVDLQDPMASDAILRPSAAGYCPPRLWFKQDLIKRGQPLVQEIVPDRNWSAMQGNIMEVALRQVLRLAGAQVLDPPREWLDGEEPETLMEPHCDGALLWPEVGLYEWTILESKYLRGTAAQQLITEELTGSRDYEYQGVSYLKGAATLVKKAGWDIPTPKQLLFVVMPKDPSMVKMFLGQALKLNKGEVKLNDGLLLTPAEEKRVDPAKVDWKLRTAERLAAFEGVYPFYSELLQVTDERVDEVWQDILAVAASLKMPWPPEPIHDPLSSDLDKECEWYCEVRDLCIQTQMKKLMTESVV
jgi:hypothetical protein